MTAQTRPANSRSLCRKLVSFATNLVCPHHQPCVFTTQAGAQPFVSATRPRCGIPRIPACAGTGSRGRAFALFRPLCGLQGRPADRGTSP
ncbi:hypothetical protein X907_1120 [Glycocaulis alkaliphilus]|uniref:Uncharacterized protein n=1 Tax=Glycocaulis alkaliphilus TaxID=1434191 RepID=A0A3T0E9A2_9PROT|nr:hypothetical protein X907_1120 [Glycocaulis alkaliphilus]